MDQQPVVIAFTGLPGTGKSTLTDRVARTIGAPAFAGDWLLGALKPHGVLRHLDRASFLAMYYDLLGTLITRQLTLGQSAVVDCLATDATAARWRELTTRFHARLLLVECVCSDVGLHRRRMEGRKRGIPGWHEVDWAHVERMRTAFPPLTTPHLTLDSAHPLDDNVSQVLAHLR